MKQERNENLLIHIGYHKTATTWLQKHLFANRDMGFAMRNGRRRLLKELVLTHPTIFDVDATWRKLDRRSFIKPDDSVLPVISLERLVGSPHTGGSDSTLIAERLAALFPQGKILIVIREQQAILLSTYKQYVRAGGRASLTRYLRPPLAGYEHIPTFRMAHFQYHHLISMYHALFGVDRVLVLPYEQLKKSPRTFVSNIIEFCQIDDEVDRLKVGRLASRERTHASLSALGTEMKRLLNYAADVPSRYHTTVPFAVRPEGRKRLITVLEALDHKMPSALKERWEQRQIAIIKSLSKGKFDQSNLLTSNLIQSNLADYGYAIHHP